MRDLKADLKRITDWQEANIAESIRWWSELIYWDAKGRDLTIDAEVAEEAIERAIKAEAEVERLRKHLEVVEKHCKETFAEIKIQHHDEIEKYKQALRIFANVDIPIEDKCWFKGKVVDMPCIKNKKLNLKCKKCVRDEFLKDGYTVDI